jgi:hypothetical protein
MKTSVPPFAFAVVAGVISMATLAGAAPLSIDEQGARHGQAIAAMQICPGAKTTGKVAELAASISDADRASFDAASNRIVAAWQKAFSCKDANPADGPRQMNGCRKAKILSCTSTWREIGPEGNALPGLLEFAPSE